MKSSSQAMDDLYNQMIGNINALMNEDIVAKHQAILDKTENITGNTIAGGKSVSQRELKRAEKMTELSNKRTGNITVEFVKVIGVLINPQEKEFSLETLSRDEQDVIGKIFFEVLKKWGDELKKKQTPENPYPTLEMTAIKKLPFIQVMFKKVAKFFRSISGRSSAAELFEQAALYCLKKQAAAAIASANISSSAENQPLLPPTPRRESRYAGSSNSR